MISNGDRTSDNRVLRSPVRSFKINIMRIVIGLFLILSKEVLNGGSASKEHVHFKIHVPDIINHQIHTKTVFIHIHKQVKPVVKKPKPEKVKEETSKNYHKETHHENWSSWNSYDHHSNQDKSNNDHNLSNIPKNHVNDIHKDIHKETSHEKINPSDQNLKDSYLPVHDNKPNYLKGQHGDMIGYSYPPQYAVQEDVQEIDHNDIEPYMQIYEKGYHKGGESTSKHTYSDYLKKFYEDKHEEDEQTAEEYKDDSVEKTDAGRYFVDDSEYQRNSDKFGAEKRSFKVSASS